MEFYYVLRLLVIAKGFESTQIRSFEFENIVKIILRICEDNIL